MLEMNSEIREKWCAALRSGKYAQNTNFLRTNEGYCCLGVLEDIRLKEQKIDWVFEEEEGWYRPGEGKSQYLLSDTGVEWAEISSDGADNDLNILMAMNDNGIKFPVIADCIEGKVIWDRATNEVVYLP